MKDYFWIGVVLCGACGHTSNAIVLFDERAEPFPKLECGDCGQYLCRPLGEDGSERWNRKEWLYSLPRTLSDRRFLLQILPVFRPVEVCLN